MKQNKTMLGYLGIALMVFGSLAGSSAMAGSCSGGKANIVDTAVNAGSFNTLLAAAEAAGLVDALKAEGPLTVFAPSDDAFAKLPAGTVESLLKPENRDRLAAILTYHVAPASLPAGKLVKSARVATLNGQRPAVTLEGDAVMIGNATVTATDIEASNGMIHVIDSVLLPSEKDIVETAVETGSFNTLAAALEAADLIGALQGEGPFTVFAPTDRAFANLPEGVVSSLLEPANKDQLTAVLTYHVVSGAIYSSDVKPGGVETLQGDEIRVSSKNGSLQINQASLVTTDIVTSNGVIHVIDEVILPEAMRAALAQTADAWAMNR